MGLACVCLVIFCYTNVVFILVALLPFPAPKHWKALLDLKLFRCLRFNPWNIYIICALPILLFLIDSIRDMWKYTVVDYDLLDGLAQKETRLSLLLAQRNFFISGQAVVQCLIVPRLISVLKDNADLSVKIGTITTALKVFRRLVGVIEDENRGYDSDDEENGESESNRRVQIDLLDAMKIELEKLNRQHKIVDDQNTFEARELDQLLHEYERRRAREDARDRQVQQYRSRYHQPPALQSTRPFQQPRRALPPGTCFSLF